MMGLMTLAAEVGSTITVIIDGEDADQALSAIADLIQNKFYED
ncbi:MAG TPA: HPr family phosphocarrier protein [Calditrichia bacterium]|nr:HPr family phosphocarrier protein [Calditrichia bacterium]